MKVNSEEVKKILENQNIDIKKVPKSRALEIIQAILYGLLVAIIILVLYGHE